MLYVTRLHQLLGLLMLLPILGWVITGVLFFIKPGYQAAYENLTVKTYPLDANLNVQPEADWQELRLMRTVLGHHLLVQQQDQLRHLDPLTLQPFSPSLAQTSLLVNEAMAANPQRYGSLIQWDGRQGLTSTGIELSLDWEQLSLRQLGPDTRRINLWYKIHYLQWTPFKALNQVLGMMGLGILFLVSVCGGYMYWRRRKLALSRQQSVR